jgi:hypothetical protein
MGVAALLVGCGSSTGSSYAARVCGDLDRWVTTVNDSLGRLRDGLDERSTTDQERRAVLEHLDDVDAATEELASAVRRAGDAPGEGSFAGRLQDGIDGVLATADEVRAEVRELPDDLEEFRAGAAPLLGARLGGAIRGVLRTLTPEEAGELGDAFAEAEECTGVLPEEAPAEPGS